MVNFLITGGCGFLGQHLTKFLLDKYPNCNIKLLDLKKSDSPLFSFKNNVSYVLDKNICDYNQILSEFKEIDIVFHLAGIVSFWIKDRTKLFNVNVKGTENVFNASINNKVKHFIHVSSVAALGYNNNKHSPINENFKFNWNIAKKYKKYYMLSKYLSDKLLINNYLENDKLKLNIVYPGLMLGPGDCNNSVKLLSAIKKRKIPFNPPGGTNIIDVRDVALGLLKVLEKGKSNEHYLLSGHNLDFKKQNKIISNVLGVKPPRGKLPYLILPLLYPTILFFEKKSKIIPQLTSDNFHSSFKFRYFDNSKARNTLKWTLKYSFEKTIRDTYSWMKRENLG
jgi:dihydroflavonol-4-reductase